MFSFLWVYAPHEIWVVWQLYVWPFEELPDCFPKWLHHFTYYKQYSLTNSSYYLLYYNHPRGHKVISHCGLDLHFLLTSDIEHFFHIFISYLCIFFGMSVHVFCLSFGLDCLPFSCCILCILDTRLLLDTWFADISHIIWIVFLHYLGYVLWSTKFSVQMKS